MIILIAIILICVLLTIGVSVPLAFGGVLILLVYTGGYDPSGFFATGHWKLNSVILLAIPLFIMAGDIMQRGKIAKPIVEIAELLFGHLRGGLSAASVVASGLFGAISGSGAATLTCIGSIIMPHLRKAKYPAGISGAIVISASPLGLLIPPSGAQLLYAWIGQLSVLKCFLATVIPGIILMIMLIIVNFVILRKDKDIQIYINSPGGSVYAGLGIYDTMQFINPQVATICTGIAASMAAVLLCAGEKGKRSGLAHSRVMIHQPLGGAQGQASDIEITAREIGKLKKELYEIIANHSGQKYDKVYSDSDRDYWMKAKEAKKYGMIDEVLTKK